MSPRLHLFEGYGVELEYMIVSRETLDVMPVCDRLIADVSGKPVSEIERGMTAWSNELALHVLEIKTNGPAESLHNLAALFQEDVRTANRLLASHGAMLLPTSMHPWMDPHTETRIWPHEYSAIYHTYDRIFDCRGHGWSNVQSVHINLPFADDAEFGRLHAAIRLVLPLLPALAASSPWYDGTTGEALDNRLRFYQTNQRRVPSVAGRIIPEPVFTEVDYREQIFDRMTHDIRPLDLDGVLDPHFLNSRGAIARFDRGAIEIRLLDIQECPRADLAVVQLVTAAVRALAEERFSSTADQQTIEVEPLREILQRAIGNADQAVIDDAAWLRTLGIETNGRTTAADVWKHLALAVEGDLDTPGDVMRLLKAGPLARRMKAAAGAQPARAALAEVCRGLAQCLEDGSFFTP